MIVSSEFSTFISRYIVYLKSSRTVIFSPLEILIKTEGSHLPYLVPPTTFHHLQLCISWLLPMTRPISDNISDRISALRLARKSTFRGRWLLNVMFHQPPLVSHSLSPDQSICPTEDDYRPSGEEQILPQRSLFCNIPQSKAVGASDVSI